MSPPTNHLTLGSQTLTTLHAYYSRPQTADHIIRIQIYSHTHTTYRMITPSLSMRYDTKHSPRSNFARSTMQYIKHEPVQCLCVYNETV